MSRAHGTGKPRTRQYVYGVLTLLVMLFIFLMSAADSDTSSAWSHSFLGTILARMIEWFRPARFGLSVEYVIRKLAHLFEFFCLGVTSSLYIGEVLLGRRRRLLLAGAAALLWSFLYACTDEWHQTFVSGRAGRFSDVLIDSSGALLGVLMIGLLARMLGKNGKEP